MTAKKQSKEASFEQELERLEALAERMESGELTLAELLAAYEEGAQLAKGLNERLTKAQARLAEVREGKDGALNVTPGDISEQPTLLDALDGQ